MLRSYPQRAALWGVLLSVVLNSAGQILFKAARSTHPEASLFSLFLFPETWIGFLVYGLSALCWLWVLSRTQLSFAYPALALTFPIVVGLSAIIFAEPVSSLRWAGVSVIVVGVSMLAKT